MTQRLFLVMSYKARELLCNSSAVMSLLRKRYDMIALVRQAVPKAHHNLAEPIITLNSPSGDHNCVPALWQVRHFPLSLFTFHYYFSPLFP